MLLDFLTVLSFTFFRVTIVINERVIADHMAKLKQQKRVPIDEEALRWTPLVSSGYLCFLYSIFMINFDVFLKTLSVMKEI